MWPALWARVVDRHFGYLRKEFGCDLVAEEDTFWGTNVTYRNATTAVRVRWDEEFDRVESSLIRLVGGQIPPYPIFISWEPTLHDFPLEHLLRLRSPAGFDQSRRMKGLGYAAVEKQLLFSASALRQFGADVLRGEFASFVPMEEKLREGVSKHPEKLTVWVPQGTVTPELAKQAARKDLVVPIVAREYVRPPMRPQADPGPQLPDAGTSVADGVDYGTPRRLHAGERAAIEALLAEPFPGRDELRDQLDHARAVGRCRCGCISIEIAVDPQVPRAPVLHKRVVSGLIDYGDLQLNLWVSDGHLDYLELNNTKDLDASQWPDPKNMSVYPNRDKADSGR